MPALAPSIYLQLTDFGDSAVLSACVFACSVYFILSSAPRAACALLLSYGLACGFTITAKLVFLACGAHLSVPGVTSPSGHSALSTAVFGMIAVLMANSTTGWRRLILSICFTGMIAIIAITRVALAFHTAQEVSVGLLIGSTALLVSWMIVLRGRALPRLNVAKLLLVLGIMLLADHGRRLPAEGFIRSLALHVKQHVALCQTSERP